LINWNTYKIGGQSRKAEEERAREDTDCHQVTANLWNSGKEREKSVKI